MKIQDPLGDELTTLTNYAKLESSVSFVSTSSYTLKKSRWLERLNPLSENKRLNAQKSSCVSVVSMVPQQNKKTHSRIDARGNLIIPFDSDKKYHLFSGRSVQNTFVNQKNKHGHYKPS